MQLLGKNKQALRNGRDARMRRAMGRGQSVLRIFGCLVCVGGVLGVSVAAVAEEPKGGEVLAAPPMGPGEDLLFEGMSAVAPTELEEARGGERTVLNLEDMMSRVENNSISGTAHTGDATVSGESFQDFNGVSSVIINSGNNVSIQSSTTVNIVIDGNR